MKPRKPQEAADLTQTLQKRNGQFSTLNRLSAIISQSESLEKSLGDVLSQLLELMCADLGSVHVLEPGSASLKLMASRGVSEKFIYAEKCIPLAECLCGEAAYTGKVIFSPDLSAEPRLSRTACSDEQLGSIISIPLKSRERVVGILTIYAKRPHHFSDTDQELLLLLSHQIGVAIENAHLYARTKELAVLQERGLIAQEMHDGIAQSLAYLNLEIKRLEDTLKSNSKKQSLSELSHFRQVIMDIYEEVRELMVEFRGGFRQNEGLFEVLSRYIKDFSQRSGIRAKLTRPKQALTLPPTTKVQVFRIIQEALSNVRKHAYANQVTVSMSTTPDALEVKIQDDGKGFDPSKISDRPGMHLGVEIMRERAAHLQGSLELDSQPGDGTTLRITIPLKSANG